MATINRRKFMQVAALTPAAMLPVVMVPAGITACGQSETLHENAAIGQNLTHDPWLEIDLANVRWNVEQIRKQVGSKPVMGVIKNNAYGLGITEIAKCLEEMKISDLAVGRVREGVMLRNAGIKSQLLNFGPFGAEDSDAIVRFRIMQSVFHDNVISLNTAAKKLNMHAEVQIKIDTGLGRVGVPFDRAAEFIRDVAKLENVKITGLFTTLTEEPEFDLEQIARLKKFQADAKSEGISTGVTHASSSSGILLHPNDGLDMVRPGICIFGHYPNTKEYKIRQIDLRPAMSLKGRVSYVKTLKPGDTLSYHRKYTARQEETIVTAGIGYSDGYPDHLTEKAFVLINGERHPVMTDVTANHFYVKIQGNSIVKPGDEIVLFGKQGNSEVTVEELAELSGTSEYKVITRTNPDTPRLYL